MYLMLEKDQLAGFSLFQIPDFKFQIKRQRAKSEVRSIGARGLFHRYF